jgi:peptidoglycan/xylan/chitin deacetylase (PgdA/CDA1 family)
MSQSPSFMRSARSALFAALDILQVPGIFRTDAPRILLYHGVTDEVGDGIFNYRGKFVTTAAFRAHLEYFKRTFEIVELPEQIERIKHGRADQTLSITFDDGYANNYTEAFPILREMQIPATFFVTTDFIEKKTPLPVDMIEYAMDITEGKVVDRIRADLALRSQMKALPAAEARALLEEVVRAHGRDLRADIERTPYRPLTWEQVAEMEAGGMTFAPHTRTHPILSRVSRAEAVEEIVGSRDTLAAHTAHPLSIFACPNGGNDDFTTETIEIIKEAGFTAALTTDARAIAPSDDAFHLPRFTMDGAGDIHRARLIASGVYNRLT